jgi:hypothetical protein
MKIAVSVHIIIYLLSHCLQSHHILLVGLEVQLKLLLDTLCYLYFTHLSLDMSHIALVGRDEFVLLEFYITEATLNTLGLLSLGYAGRAVSTIVISHLECLITVGGEINF